MAQKNLTPEFTYMLDQMRNRKMNGLIVFESAAKYIGEMMPYLTDFEVRGVAMYQRLYEFMPSAWAQTMFESNFGNGIRSPCGRMELPSFQSIAFSTSDEMQSLALGKKVCRKFLQGKIDSIWEGGGHRAQKYLDRMSKNGVTAVTMMDYHANHDDVKGNSLLVELFCGEGIPNTNYTCTAVKEDKLENSGSSKNLRHRIDLVALASESFDKGLSKIRPSDYTSFNTLKKKFQNVDESKLPKECMSKEKMDRLYALSWKNERSIFPDRDERYHREAFESSVSNQKFCSLDVDTLLKDEEWQLKLKSWFK